MLYHSTLLYYITQTHKLSCEIRFIKGAWSEESPENKIQG